jgi:hypothetical protein
MRQRGTGNTNCSSLSYAGALVAELRVACPQLVSGIRSVGCIASLHEGGAATQSLRPTSIGAKGI